VEALDDALSMVTGMEFFGKETKTYHGKPARTGDPAPTFCTIPVKYKFKDRDTRARVENVLRSRCQVNCSTPYPSILRECIKRTVDSFKTAYPGNYVRVNVDTANFNLRVALKKQETGSTWVNHNSPIPLPEEAWDTTARKVPFSMLMTGLPSAGTTTNQGMVVDPSSPNVSIFKTPLKTPSSPRLVGVKPK